MKRIVFVASWFSFAVAATLAVACGAPSGPETGGSQSSAIEVSPEPPAYPCRLEDGGFVCPGLDAGNPPPVCDPPCAPPRSWCTATPEGTPVCRFPPPRPLSSEPGVEAQ